MFDGLSMTTSSERENAYHVPVLADEVLAALALPRGTSGGVWFDGTVGGGGHASRILDAIGPAGRLIAVDRDADALAAATARLGNRATFVHGNFDEVDLEPGSLDGALLDLGVSSHQIDTAERGFSFAADGPLDMRMDRRQNASAADLVNQLAHGELARLFREYGEEKNAGRIATEILRRREKQPFTRTRELVSAVVAAFGGREKKGGINVATRTFQGLRIAVNAELSALERALPRLLDALTVGGRLAVISFHSLEDRIVKHTFRDWATGCVCPKDFPVCRCGRSPRVSLVTKKGVKASESESKANPRARSAILRAIEKLSPGARA